MDLKLEISAIQSCFGEVVVATFCDLESLIKTDTGKTPVPDGVYVHPLTGYVMNYVKYACEYKNTLEHVFKDYHRIERPSSYDDDRDDEPPGSASNNDNQSNDSIADDPKPFAAQLMVVMELLHSNLEAKSKLYKDQALCNIFLMNNGRYVMKKIKGAAEIKKLLGDAWCWKRSLEFRQYHKNYQRETWSKVLTCLKDERLNVRRNVSKPVLKERFKSFNAMIDENHKTQSLWVVSNEQLQLELRVSISAVLVPACRSFLGGSHSTSTWGCKRRSTSSLGRMTSRVILMSSSTATLFPPSWQGGGRDEGEMASHNIYHFFFLKLFLIVLKSWE